MAFGSLGNGSLLTTQRKPMWLVVVRRQRREQRVIKARLSRLEEWKLPDGLACGADGQVVVRLPQEGNRDANLSTPRDTGVVPPGVV